MQEYFLQTKEDRDNHLAQPPTPIANSHSAANITLSLTAGVAANGNDGEIPGDASVAFGIGTFQYQTAL